MSQKRKQISLELKLEVLKRFKSGEKAVEIGRSLDLTPTTVRTICNRDADKIKEFAKTATPLQSTQITKKRSHLMVKMESLLTIWIETQNQQRMPLSKMVIQNKALSLYSALKDSFPSTSHEQFEASQGWFERFKSRANLHNVSLKGESASADISAANKFKIELKAIIEEGGYSAKQVVNVDETGLFWKRLPGRTYISKAEKSCPGFKVSKDRLTLLLGGNAEGDFKFKPFLIYHSENPRAFKNVTKNDLPVYWRANKKAWMTAALFKDWLENCAVPDLKLYCSKQNIEFKVLLLLDNAPGHPIYSDEFSENIKVVFMPPNTTSVIQPMDQGVISNFKCYYLRRTFSQLIAETDGEDKLNMKEFWKKYNIKMAIDNIQLSWLEVKKSCMNGCWREIWPECISKNVEDINCVPTVRREVAELATAARFEGMEEGDIDELLISHDEELNNESLIGITLEHALEDEIDAPAIVTDEKKLTTVLISEAMQLISRGLEIFSDNDPDETRSLKVAKSVTDAINCYQEIYLEKKAVTVQQTMDRFLTKSIRQANMSPEMTIDLESTIPK